MLIVHSWDQICGEWTQHELDLPHDTRDPALINTEFAQTTGDDETEPTWEVRSHSQTGPILTIECRSTRNHLSILIVNSEQQG